MVESMKTEEPSTAARLDCFDDISSNGFDEGDGEDCNIDSG